MGINGYKVAFLQPGLQILYITNHAYALPHLLAIVVVLVVVIPHIQALTRAHALRTAAFQAQYVAQYLIALIAAVTAQKSVMGSAVN
jgi:hypothetical protein